MPRLNNGVINVKLSMNEMSYISGTRRQESAWMIQKEWREPLLL